MRIPYALWLCWNICVRRTRFCMVWGLEEFVQSIAIVAIDIEGVVKWQSGREVIKDELKFLALPGCKD